VRANSLVILAALAAFGVIGSNLVANAADPYPSRTVRIVVPYAAGGPTDTIARILAAPLQELLGQPVIIENKPGANTNIGTGYVAKSEADGYTLLMTSTTFTINPSIYKSSPYDAVKDFEPLKAVASSPNVFVASKASGLKSLSDVIAREKEKPGSLNYGTAGIGTPTHLAAELLNVRAGTNIVHVPFSGGAPAMQAVLGGQIELGSLALPNVQGNIEAGMLVPIAITSERRWPSLPNVPTMIELGYPGFVSETAILFLSPKNTPADVLTKLTTAMDKILERKAVQDSVSAQGFMIQAGGPDVLRARISKELGEYKDIAIKAKISMF
jgi:tripartite-type tricarboxylate transporter receptor subunit TctC